MGDIAVYKIQRWGRKKSFFLCLTIMIVFGVLTAFAPNMLWWSVCRFFVGMTVPAILHIPFVICKKTWNTFHNFQNILCLSIFVHISYLLTNVLTFNWFQHVNNVNIFLYVNIFQPFHYVLILFGIYTYSNKCRRCQRM